MANTNPAVAATTTTPVETVEDIIASARTIAMTNSDGQRVPSLTITDVLLARLLAQLEARTNSELAKK